MDVHVYVYIPMIVLNMSFLWYTIWARDWQSGKILLWTSKKALCRHSSRYSCRASWRKLSPLVGLIFSCFVLLYTSIWILPRLCRKLRYLKRFPRLPCSPPSPSLCFRFSPLVSTSRWFAGPNTPSASSSSDHSSGSCIAATAIVRNRTLICLSLCLSLCLFPAVSSTAAGIRKRKKLKKQNLLSKFKSDPVR